MFTTSKPDENKSTHADKKIDESALIRAPKVAKAPDSEVFYEKYWSHYHVYLLDNVPPNSSLFNELYYACQYLLMAAVSGHRGAQVAALHYSRSTLPHELPKVCDQEYGARLQEVPPVSKHYDEAQLTLFLLYYSRRYRTVYSTYQERVQDIVAALTPLQRLGKGQRPLLADKFLKTVIPDYPCKLTPATIKSAAWRMLSMELMGEDPLLTIMHQHMPNVSPMAEMNYPFRLLSADQMAKDLGPAFSRDYTAVDRVIATSKEHLAKSLTVIHYRAAKPNFYSLNLDAQQLKNRDNTPICFVDDTTGEEFARLEWAENQVQVTAYGAFIHLKIQGVLDVPALMIDNPEGNVVLTANWTSQQTVYLAGHVKKLDYRGHIQTAQQIRIEMDGEVEVATESELEANMQIGFKSESLVLHGKIHSEQLIQADIHGSLVMSADSECSSVSGTLITAGSFKDMRGRIVSEGLVKVDSRESIYLHGAAELHGKAGLIITGKSLLSTDKASVKTDGTAQVTLSETLIVDKQSVWSAGAFNLHDRTFKNYSPHFSAKKAVIRSENETVNYPPGVITTQVTLQLTGGSVWNGGQMHYGQLLQVKLNKLFVHGITSVSELSHLRKVFNQAQIQGGDANIVAGAALNVLGFLKVRNLTLAAIAEFNIGMTSSLSSSKSRLISLDMGIDIPNFAEMSKEISQFCHAVSDGEFTSALKMAYSFNKASNVGRWILRTLLPAAGKGIDFVWSTYLFVCSTPALYAQCENLYHSRKKVESSDLYALIATASNLAVQASSLETQAASLIDDVMHYSPSDSKAGVAAAASESPSLDQVLPAVALDIASFFMPISSDKSVLNIRAGGLHCNATLLQQSGLAINMGGMDLGLSVTDIFLDSFQEHSLAVAGNHSHIGRSLDRSGVTVALMDTTNVLEEKESGLTVAQRVDWQNQNLNEDATVVAQSVHAASTNTFEHNGNVTGKKSVSFSAGHYEEGAGSRVESKEGVLTIAAKTAVLAGTENANQVTIFTKESATVALSAQVVGGKVLIDGGKKTTIEGSVHATAESKEVTDSNGKTSLAASLIIKGDSLTTGIDSVLKAENGEAVIVAEKADLAGTEEAKVVLTHTTESTHIANTAHVTGERVIIDGGDQLTIDGSLHATGESKELTDANGNKLVDAPLLLKAKTLTESVQGDLKAENGEIVISSDNAVVAGNEEAKNVVMLVTGTAQLTDTSHITAETVYIEGDEYTKVEGTVNAKVQHYKSKNRLDVAESAHLSSPSADSVVVLEAPTGSIGGHIDVQEIDFKIDHGISVEDLLLKNGVYKDITPRGSLFVETKDEVIFNHAIDLAYSFGLSAYSVTVNSYLHSQHDIALEATVGDIATNGCTLRADGTLSLIAQGAYYNQKGNISGTNFFIHTQGSVVNNAGTLLGNNYLEIVSEHGNVENHCEEHDVRGAYGTMKEYKQGHMLGGTGEGHDGTGLYIHAGGKVVNDASVMGAIGNNNISGDAGVETIARTHRYVSFYRHDKTWYGKETEKMDISTQVEIPVIYSVTGKNTVVSQGGVVNSCSTRFQAPGLTYIYGKNDVTLTGVITDTKQYSDSSGLWGLISDSNTGSSQSAVPTQIVTLSDVHIVSQQNVNLDSAAFYTPGKVTLAGRNVTISAPILQHSQNHETRGFDLQGPSFPCGQSFSPYNDFQNLLQSHNGTETAANSWNLFVDGLNTANGLLSAVRTGSVLQAAFPVSSMTVGGMGYTQNQTNTRWQTVAPNVGIQCGSLSIEAVDTVSFLNGVSVAVAGNASIHAKHFIQQGAALYSSMTSDTQHIDFGLSADGRATASAAISQSGFKATTHQNQSLYVGGILDLQIGDWQMSDANVFAGSLSGNVGSLAVVSHTDSIESYGRIMQASTNGSFAVQRNTSRSEHIGTVSGIEVGGSADLDVGTAYLEGGSLLFDGKNRVTFGSVTAHAVDEYTKGNSYGLCGNGYDLIGGDSSRSWSQAIPTFGIQRGGQNYQANEQPTVFSGGGSLSIGSLSGALNTTSRSGLHVTRDDHFSYEVKVPLYNQQGLKQLHDNVGWLGERLRPRQEQHVADVRELPHECQTDHAEHQAAEKHTHAPSNSSLTTKHHSDEADDFFVEDAERTIYEVDCGLHQSTRITGNGVRLFSNRGGETKDHAPNRQAHSNKWATSDTSRHKWQTFWNVVDELDREDAIAIDVINEIGRAVDPRNIWSGVKRDSADLDQRVLHGKVFSREALSDVVGMASVFPFVKEAKLGVEALSYGVGRLGLWGERGQQVTEFATRDFLDSHFNKHSSEFKSVYSTAEEYLKGARDVIKEGVKISYEYKGETRIGYVKFMGNVSRTGDAKFEFVGTNNLGNITTYHVESGASFWKMLNRDANNKNITPYAHIDLELTLNSSYIRKR